MGAALFEAEALDYRPPYFDRLRVYEAADGEVLYQVYGRHKDAAYYVLRWACRLARFTRRVERALGRDVSEGEPINPNGLEKFGTWDSEEKAQAECFYLKERSGGRLAVGYNEVRVNRTYGYERRPMKGLTDPTRWLHKGKPSAEQARYKLVEVGVDGELAALTAEAEDIRRLTRL